MKRILAAPAVIAILAALLTGCAEQQPDPTAPNQPGPTPDAQAYAQCMRDHGVDMADPDPETGLPQLGDGVDPDHPAVQEAAKACQDLMPAGAREQDDGQDTYLKFAECMRENGLPDFPDPQPGSKGGVFGDSGVDRNDPAFQRAAEACQHLLAGNQP